MTPQEWEEALGQARIEVRERLGRLRLQRDRLLIAYREAVDCDGCEDHPLAYDPDAKGAQEACDNPPGHPIVCRCPTPGMRRGAS